MLRVLRPLRMISKNEGLKIAVVSLFNAVPQISDALVISGVFFLVFAIFGTMYFKGKFYYCNFTNIMGFLDTSQIITKWDCMNCGGEWRFYDINFDNVPMSFIVLFNLATTEGWATVMWRGVDAVDVDMAP